MILDMQKRGSLLFVVVIVGCSPPAVHSSGRDLIPPDEAMIDSTSEPARTGILVMAHGAVFVCVTSCRSFAIILCRVTKMNRISIQLTRKSR